MKFSRPILITALRIFLFFFFLEIFLRTEGFVRLSIQELENKSQSKGSGSYRVMCLGDSSTYLGGNDSYPSQLEEILNARSKTQKFEVINKGIPGKTTSDFLDSLEGFLNKDKPDMVVIMLGMNDGQFHQAMPVGFIPKLKLLVFDKFQSYKLMKRVYHQLRDRVRAIRSGAIGDSPQTGDLVSQRKEEIPPEDSGEISQQQIFISNVDIPIFDKTKNHVNVHPLNSSDDPIVEAKKKEAFQLKSYHPLTIRNYNQMVETLLLRGIKVVCMQYPLRDVSPLKQIISRKTEVVFVENNQSFQEAMKHGTYADLFADSLIGDDLGHCTRKGNRMIAENLANAILRQIDTK